ncbi:hypothetical protein [Terrilactibacillus tamarindi]|nr:hypothetical protein [Terrilactibacillus tamarindi]
MRIQKGDKLEARRLRAAHFLRTGIPHDAIASGTATGRERF